MSFKIASHEFQLASSRNHASIRTLVPAEALEDGSLLLPRIRGAGFEAGDHITVQVMTDNYARLVAEADFVVASIHKERRLVAETHRERMSEEVTFTLARKGPWWFAPGQEPQPAAAPPVPAEVKWNLGTKTHQVVRGDEMLFESADKAKATDWLMSMDENKQAA